MAAASRAAKLSEDTAERERSAQLLDQPQGIELARKEAQLLLSTAEAATARLIEVSSALKLSQERGNAASNFHFLNIHGPKGLSERFDYQEYASNTASSDCLGIRLYRYTSAHEEARKPATKIAERKFVPFITLENKVLWKGDDGLHESIELIESSHTEFIDQIAKEQKQD